MNIHPQTVIHPKAVLGDGVTVGPFTTIESGAQIGEGTEIGPNVLICKETQVGRHCKIHHGASLGGDPQIANWNEVPSRVVVGDHTTVREYVTIHRSGFENQVTRVGDHCLLMAYAHVAHDCILGNHVVLVNGAGLSGHVAIDDHAFVSGIVGVHQFVRIGGHSMIAGGVMVRQDVLPYSLVKGPPTQLSGVNAVGLRRRNFSRETLSALKSAFKFLSNPEYNTSQALERIRAEIEMTEEIRNLIGFIEGSSRGIIK